MRPLQLIRPRTVIARFTGAHPMRVVFDRHLHRNHPHTRCAHTLTERTPAGGFCGVSKPAGTGGRTGAPSLAVSPRATLAPWRTLIRVRPQCSSPRADRAEDRSIRTSGSQWPSSLDRRPHCTARTRATTGVVSAPTTTTHRLLPAASALLRLAKSGGLRNVPQYGHP